MKTLTLNDSDGFTQKAGIDEETELVLLSNFIKVGEQERPLNLMVISFDDVSKLNEAINGQSS